MKLGKKQKWITVAMAGALCVASVFLSSLSGHWRNEDKAVAYIAQYEDFTESVLRGHFYFDDLEVDPTLEEMENPYDFEARTAAGAKTYWDHVYYNGKYYMYFGIAPVFLAFLPFRVLTGGPLYAYHATQLFVILTIVGMFALFYFLAKNIFKKLPFGVYLILATAAGLIATLYSWRTPAMYCTAIMAGVALETWSLYFFMRGLWGKPKRQMAWLVAGGVCGALVFACRPPVALGNVVLVPFLVQFLRGKKFNWKLAGRILAVALPYLIIGGGLMAYNYARFGNPLEFGQAYQMTNSDQSAYGSGLLGKTSLLNVANGVMGSLFDFAPLSGNFPYINFGGAFVDFPILLLLILGLAQTKVRKFLKKQKLFGVVIGLIAAVILVAAIDALWSPFHEERYNLDLYYLLAVLDFIVVAAWYETTESRKLLYGVIIALGVYTAGFAGLYYLYPADFNVTWEHPEILEQAVKILKLGF